MFDHLVARSERTIRALWPCPPPRRPTVPHPPTSTAIGAAQDDPECRSPGVVYVPL